MGLTCYWTVGSQPPSGWLKPVLSACLSCFLTSAEWAHTPLYTYKHQDKTNSDEQIGHSHHIHPSTDSQRHGCGSVGHQYQGQHKEEEPSCNSLVSCQKGKSPVNNCILNPKEVPLDSYTRQGKQEERPSLELAGTMHAPVAQRALLKDVVKQIPVLHCWCLCLCPSPPKLWRQAHKFFEGSASEGFVLQIEELNSG